MYSLYYSLVSVVALFVLLACNADIVFNKRYQPENPKTLRAYRLFILALAGYYISDLLWGYLEVLDNKIPVTIDTAFYFVFMSLVVCAWENFVTYFIEKQSKISKIILRIIGLLLALYGISLVIANIFTSVLFSYETGVYTVNEAHLAYLASQIVLFVLTSIYSFISAFRIKDRYHRAQYFVLSAFGFIMTLCISFQMFYPLYPIYAIGTLSGTTLVYTFIVITHRIRSREQIQQIKKREEEQTHTIESTRQLAYIDPLTGVKNKHAYVEFENKMDQLIRDHQIEQFSLVVFDLNDLKNINDTYGHDAGDKYITDSCKLISDSFPGADIYRYGGDEFVIFIQGELYETRFERLKEFNSQIEKNIDTNGPVIACGISDFIKEKDNTLRNVFTRGDDRMYGRKRRLKDLKGGLLNDSSFNKSTGVSLFTLRCEMYEMFYRSAGVSLLDMLNASSCDEILEANIKKDTFKQIYHVEGKYFVPAVNLSYKDLLDFTYKYIVHQEDQATFLQLMQIDGFFERLSLSRIPNFDFAHFRYKLLDGSYRWVEQVVITGEEFGIPEGSVRVYVFDINNVKTRQLGIISNESTVVSLGNDPLTGLLNSKDFLLKAEKLVKKESNKNWCLVASDIDHFKLFDEWFGREKGNFLLAKIGAEFKEFEQKNHALAGYFGHDDISLLCEYDRKKIEELFDKVHEIIDSFGLTAGFMPAFGIAMIEQDMAVVDVLDRAAIAVNQAKTDLQNRIYVYDYQMQFLIEQEHTILTEFIHALQNDEITFYLQPQCRTASGRIVGAEALSRWVKKDGSIVSPMKFIPVLEKYGFIINLDKYIWEKVCKWLREWLDAGHKAVPISLNISRIDIFNMDIAEYFIELCDKYKIPHKLVKLEITESAYAETTDVIDELVKTLRSNGFMVLMDDFGSGYSSLNMLSTLKLDAIKLDANFLHIENSDHTRGIHILESVINMAKTMALPIIVEGVEKKNQLEFLGELGVLFVQGYYFYKPMPIKDFESIIVDEDNIDDRGFFVKSNEQFRIREFLDKNVYSDSMLNNIIGAVAIYSYNGKTVDIIRYNQQFFEAVNVPDFVERLINIEQFMPEEDRSILHKVLEETITNKLTGSSVTLRFRRTNGVLTSFKMRFYYLGKKEGSDRFYGSVSDITELTDFVESKKLIAKYSSDNIIFVSKISDKWQYSVMSHALSDLIGLNPKELEEELNNGEFAKRVTPQKDLKEFMKQVPNMPKEKEFTILTNKNQKVKIHINIQYVGDESNNVEYILRTTKAE